MELLGLCAGSCMQIGERVPEALRLVAITVLGRARHLWLSSTGLPETLSVGRFGDDITGITRKEES